jgi:hypothetical protein
MLRCSRLRSWWDDVAELRKDVGVGVSMSSGDCCCENNHAQKIAHPMPPGMRVSHGTCRQHH